MSKDNDGIKTYYVYPTTLVDGKHVRIKGKRPLGCVALYRGEDSDGVPVICRGISICAATDNFSYADGSNKAKGMCRKAMESQKSTRPIGFPVILKDAEVTMESAVYFLQEWMNSYGAPVPNHKSAYNVLITDYEKKILDFSDKPKA